MFTTEIGQQLCIEGNPIQVTCLVNADNVEVEWYNGSKKIHECMNVSKTSNGRQHTLRIENSTMGDSGMYKVMSENVTMEFKVTVKGNFN